jgi:hypothetical protein
MDGGGVRTLASITFLKLLEKKLGVKIMKNLISLSELLQELYLVWP